MDAIDLDRGIILFVAAEHEPDRPAAPFRLLLTDQLLRRIADAMFKCARPKDSARRTIPEGEFPSVPGLPYNSLWGFEVTSSAFRLDAYAGSNSFYSEWIDFLRLHAALSGGEPGETMQWHHGALLCCAGELNLSEFAKEVDERFPEMGAATHRAQMKLAINDELALQPLPVNKAPASRRPSL